MKLFETPILIISFNRPSHTRRVWNEIIKQHPKIIYIFQDGARVGKNNDIEKCNAVREIFEDILEWECEIKTYYSEINLGCGLGPANAITWFFKHVEYGIIFEDDCLPSDSLFLFYEELLYKYNNDNRVGLITGTNLLSKWRSNRTDYFFCKSGGATMGSWASWSKVWCLFDYNIISWNDAACKKAVKNFVGNRYYKVFREELNEYFNNGQKHSWDYQWAYARYLHNKLTIVSSVNLMSNIGFGKDATHTTTSNDRRSNMQSSELTFPLRVLSIKKHDFVYDFLLFYRFSYKKKKSLVLKIVLKLIELFYCR